jgi:hypothetical protein
MFAMSLCGQLSAQSQSYEVMAYSPMAQHPHHPIKSWSKLQDSYLGLKALIFALFLLQSPLRVSQLFPEGTKIGLKQSVHKHRQSERSTTVS